LTTALVLGALLCLAPSRAHADGLFTPWIGTNFANEIADGRTSFGFTATGMGGGVIGGEFDFGYSPNFFGEESQFGSNNVLTLVGNLVLGIPLGGSSGFGFRPYGTVGLGLIRSKVFLASLETEKKLARGETPGRAALTLDNYVFEPRDLAAGLSALGVTPRREDVMLVNGSIFLRPDTGELVRLEGRLSKAPSFWVRQVDVVRRYQHIGGVGLPISLEAVAKMRLAGHNTFRMTYQYESVNGQNVGGHQFVAKRPPIPRAASMTTAIDEHDAIA
jgi:hypothetical protein